MTTTDGAIYDPRTDAWTPIPPIDLPEPPTDRPDPPGHTSRAAVWVGVGLVVVEPTRDGYEVATWSPV